MILYHVNNPSAPAFIHTCDSCNQDILKGNRWECELCSEYDLCDSCKVKTVHAHPLKAVAVVGTAEDDDSEVEGSKDEQALKAQRQLMEQKKKESIELHLNTLQHAVACNPTPDAPCKSALCTRIKVRQCSLSPLLHCRLPSLVCVPTRDSQPTSHRPW
jgi:E1A/CREB-binding protein